MAVDTTYPTTDPNPTTSTPAADRLLTIYLDDHRAGAAAGLALARRFASANSMSPVGDAARQLCRRIEEDVRVLDEVIERFDHTPSHVKMAAARVAEWIGRLKMNGVLRRYSPLSRLLEIEMLSAGILTKESLWKTLAVLQQHRPVLVGIDFDELQTSAQQQRALLDSHRAPAAAEAFLPGVAVDAEKTSG